MIGWNARAHEFQVGRLRFEWTGFESWGEGLMVGFVPRSRLWPGFAWWLKLWPLSVFWCRREVPFIDHSGELDA